MSGLLTFKFCIEPTSFPVVVDYSLSLEAMIAVGKYDWRFETADHHFLIKGDGKHEYVARIAGFVGAMATESVERELDKLGLRPALTEELLAFGATFSEAQRSSPIVSLGSSKISDGTRRCMSDLVGDANGRGLRLYSYDGVFLEPYRFLAIPKAK